MSESYRSTVTLHLLRALQRGWRSMDATAGSYAASLGLHSSEMDVVFTLGNTEGLRMGDLAARMLTSPPNVTRIAKRLEERGLVRREKNESSEREVLAHLTPQGVALFEEAYPQVYRLLREHFDRLLKHEEQQSLIALLEKLVPSAHSP